MKNHKKSYCRCLCVILCALLLIPLFASVPVYAADSFGTMPNSSVSWSIEGDTLSFSGLGSTGSFGNTSEIPWNGDLSIKNVIINDGITEIGGMLVSNLNLDSFVIPSSVISLASYAFYYLSMDSFHLPSSITSLPFRCFYHSSINSLYIPSSVTSANNNAFDYFTGSLFMESPTPPSWVIGSSSASISKIFVPPGSGQSYKSDSAWSKFASIIYELDSPTPTVPSLTTSFDGQVISLEAGSLRFFITATNVNGTLSCQWYVNGAPISGEWSFIEAEPGVWLQGWVYTPIENGTREIYCIVTNTLGDKSESVSTGTVIVHYGVSGGGGGGSGDLSQVTDKLDVLDMEISDLKQSVELVQEGIDSINDSLTVTDPALNDAVGAFDEGSAEVDAFEQQQWQDFEENSHVITDQFQIFSDTGTMVGAFTLVSGIVHNTFNSLGPWQPVLTIPLAIAIILFIWSRAPGNDKPRKTDPVSKGNRYQGSPDGPGEFRKSSFYDSDRDQSPL